MIPVVVIFYLQGYRNGGFMNATFPLTQEDKEGFFLMGQLSKNGAQFFVGIQMTKLSVFRCLVRNTGVTN